MTEIVERAALRVRVKMMDAFGYEMSKDESITLVRAAIEAMRELPGEPGPRYTAGEYSRRSHEAMIDDALGVQSSP
jgi:hypothetical protein